MKALRKRKTPFENCVSQIEVFQSVNDYPILLPIGESRGFAFVEFATVEEAVQWYNSAKKTGVRFSALSLSETEKR